MAAGLDNVQRGKASGVNVDKRVVAGVHKRLLGALVLFLGRPAKEKEGGAEHTCRPAREEWLCCFLGPSTPEVLPPELLPPEDLPFPPAIVAMHANARG
jgi:hypothetical protein